MREITYLTIVTRWGGIKFQLERRSDEGAVFLGVSPVGRYDQLNLNGIPKEGDHAAAINL